MSLDLVDAVDFSYPHNVYSGQPHTSLFTYWYLPSEPLPADPHLYRSRIDLFLVPVHLACLPGFAYSHRPHGVTGKSKFDHDELYLHIPPQSAPTAIVISTVFTLDLHQIDSPVATQYVSLAFGSVDFTTCSDIGDPFKAYTSILLSIHACNKAHRQDLDDHNYNEIVWELCKLYTQFSSLVPLGGATTSQSEAKKHSFELCSIECKALRLIALIPQASKRRLAAGEWIDH
ncbi:hypothetical protein GGF38_005414, partial [Coemansia sp. RSA 25]